MRTTREAWGGELGRLNGRINFACIFSPYVGYHPRFRLFQANFQLLQGTKAL